MEKQFENINFTGAYHHYTIYHDEAEGNNIYAKHLKLGVFLDGELNEHHYTNEDNEDRYYEYEPEPEEDGEEH